MRLSQQRKISGTHGRFKLIGLAAYNCAQCDKSGPRRGLEEKILRNCKRPDIDLKGQGIEREYQIDNTGIFERDTISFCPASVADPSVMRNIARVFDIERLSSLGRATARPLLHQPLRIKTFFLATLAARDRFNDEEAAALTEVTKPL